MKFVADVHIHSHFSRATSKSLNFEHLNKWAQLKGVQVVGTGDIAHPGWLQEMKQKLESAEAGLFKLKDEYASEFQREVPVACQVPVRFMLAGEISSIYKKNDRVRKIHNVIFAPTLEAVEKIQAALEKIGNIRSDGRPILGLDSRDLLEIILDIDEQNYIIPAHIWTPWFSLLGSKSGFDSVEECFEDLTPHIFACNGPTRRHASSLVGQKKGRFPGRKCGALNPQNILLRNRTRIWSQAAKTTASRCGPG